MRMELSAANAATLFREAIALVAVFATAWIVSGVVCAMFTQ